MEITGNTSALLALFETAKNEIHAGRPETIAEAIDAYRIFWNTRCRAKFTDGRILESLSNLRIEWSAFLSREPNTTPEKIAAVSNAVSQIHKTIEDVLKGKAIQANFNDLINRLHSAATAVVAGRGQSKESVAEEVATKLKPELEVLKQETQQVGEKVDKAKRTLLEKLTLLLTFQKDWKTIFGKLFRYKKIPTSDVSNAMEDRYAGIDWSHFKHKDGIQQIKDVINYTYDVKAVTTGVSEKHYKKASGGNGINLKDACREAERLHKEEWDKMDDPYPSIDDLYAACHGLANRKHGKNPFKTI